MMLKLMGRVALLASVSVALVCGLTSCASSTLGYLYVTTLQYNQVASLRLDINNGQVKSVHCNTGNGEQSNCITGSGGSYATKVVLADSDTLMYVLNAATVSSTGTPIPASITLFTLGSGGSVFNTGQSYQSYGQNTVDMYLSPSANYLYVLDQYQPADQPGCANPTPTTCKGDVMVFSIDGKGDLVPVSCGTSNGCLSGSDNDGFVFPINYEPGPLNSGYGGSRMLAINNSFFVLDESTPDTSSTSLGTPEIHFFAIGSGGVLSPVPIQPVTPGGAKQLSSIIAGTHVYVSDYQTGQIWIYPITPGSAAYSVVCPSQLVQPGTACTVNPGSNSGQNVALDAMVANGTYLYAADYANNTIFAMQDTSNDTYLKATDGGNNTSLGTSSTCLTLSSNPEFLYASGDGIVAGEQVNTSTGGLSTSLHPNAIAPFTGVVPCLMFSPRT